MWKTAFVVLAGISLLAISLIYATSSKQTDPATVLQSDANGSPVQPLNPATGINEMGASALTPYSPEMTANSNMTMTMPQPVPNSDGFGDGYNPWARGVPPPGAPPMYQQIPPGGQMIDPNNPNSIFMQDGTVLVPVPVNANTSVNANTKPTTANTNVKAAPANTTTPPATPTPAATPQPSPTKMPVQPAPKPTTPPVKTPPAATDRSAQSGKEQDS